MSIATASIRAWLKRKARQKGRKASPPFPLATPDDLTGVQINDQRVEFLVPAKVNLIDGQTLERAEAGVAIVLLQPSLDDVLDRIPAQSRQRRQIGHRHPPPQTLDKDR